MDSLGENDVILFQDECSVQYVPTLTRMWSLKGNQPKISSPGGRQRQHIIGAVDPLLGRVHVGLSERLKAEQFKQFLAYLVKFYSTIDKIVLVVDNARAHHAKIIQDFLQERGHKIELVYLPAYSPELNPMERFWKHMRKKVTHNMFFKTFKEFLRSLISFLGSSNSHHRRLRLYVEFLNSL